MNKKHLWLILGLIIFLGAFLRLFWLDRYPVGVTADEIQQGYTGYSILKTGKDEWGDFLPINPRGFGDYKPPLYSYLTIPFEVVLGLNIISTRLPSVVAGLIDILLIFLLARAVFKDTRIGIIAALFLSLASWHVYFSRVAFESSIGLVLFLTGILFFIKSFQKNKFLVFSSICFGLSLFTYHSFKLLVLMFVGGLVLLYGRKLLTFNKKYLVWSSLIWVICSGLIVFGFFFAGGGRRAEDVAFYKEGNLSQLRQLQTTDTLPSPWNRILHSKADFLVNKFAQNYLAYFSPSFYISPDRSDASLFNMTGQSLVPIWQILLAFLGGALLLLKKNGWRKLFILWVLLAPVPAALATEYMYAQRVEGLLVLFPFLAAFGMIMLWEMMVNWKFRTIFFVILFGVIVLSNIKWIDFYFTNQFNKPLGGLKYGYQQVIDFTQKNGNKYDQIIFTKYYSEPQAFVAFYSQMDPVIFQKNAQNWIHFEKDGFAFLDMIDYSLGKYKFENIKWEDLLKYKNSLFVVAPNEIPQDWPKELTVKSPSGAPIFVVVDSNKI